MRHARLLPSLFLGAILSLAPAHSRADAPIRAEHVELRVWADGPTTLAVHYKLEPEWHVYWKNAGDSGAAPKFKVTGGGAIERVLWPYPSRIPVADLTNFGYESEVVFPLEVKPEPGAKALKLSLEWLVCKVECVPGFAKLELPLPLQAEPGGAAAYGKFRARVPAETLPARTLDRTPGALIVELEGEPAQARDLFVFPEDGETFLTKAPSIEPAGAGKLHVSLPLSPNAPAKTGETELTLVATSKDGQEKAFLARVSYQPPAQGMLGALALAFLGGLILNLMPCVFPILSLKVFGFLSGKDEKEARKGSWLYSAGVIVSFIAVGGALTALRLSGESLGWGFQLQSPAFVFALVFLFYAMALNFYGFFELGESLHNAGSKLRGDFGTGVLAVVVASPCTAPFMGAALGATLLLPPSQSILVFASLGAGMAAPMLLLAHSRAFARRMPKPGAWMLTLKQFMAFPLLATALWLVWVLGNQKGADAIVSTLLSLLLLTLGLWLRNVSGARVGIRAIAWATLLASAVAGYVLVDRAREAGAAHAGAASAWSAFDAASIEEKRKTQPVFVDFTASWCITCQVNKRAVLDTPAIQSLFREQGVHLVRADWTRQDPAITKALASFGRNSVPLYVYYRPGQEALRLPELLTAGMIQELFTPKEGESK